jgi:hypothetical protein
MDTGQYLKDCFLLPGSLKFSQRSIPLVFMEFQVWKFLTKLHIPSGGANPSISTKHDCRDHSHLFSILQLDSELPGGGRHLLEEGKGMSSGEREGAKDKLWPLH